MTNLLKSAYKKSHNGKARKRWQKAPSDRCCKHADM